MTDVFEYKVIPAPTKGIKAKGVKAPEDRFALGIEQAINELAVQGWTYHRSDVLPSEERQGLTGTITQWRTLLVFRRALRESDETEAPAPQRREPVLTPPAPPVKPTTDNSADDIPYEEGTEETRPA
ncbi:DUF4177 domain-containing protein [Marivita sp. S2033]|uniref:DUF4177 domain-containing protein n=1 Tax=Marivita sp. S2033 TaxID=3373187 RepID=UPI0039829BDB